MPTLFKNPTSPFARIAHAALIEADVPDLEVSVVDQWSDPPELLAVNTAGRVPCLVLDDGTVMPECLLIAMHAGAAGRRKGVLAAGDAACLSLAGIALGVSDAAVATLVGRRILSGGFADKTFDGQELGRKRRRAMIDGLKRIEPLVPERPSEVLDLGVIAAVAALDYVHLRFPGAGWIPPVPRLQALREATADRSSLAGTRPPQ